MSMVSDQTAAPTDKMLRTAFLGNAVFSVISAFVFTVFAPLVADFLGLDLSPLVVMAAGVGLLGFGCWVGFQAWRPVISPSDAWGIVFGDLGWVAATVLLWAFFPDLFSDQGWIVADLVALAVLTFAILQTIGIRRMNAS